MTRRLITVALCCACAIAATGQSINDLRNRALGLASYNQEQLRQKIALYDQIVVRMANEGVPTDQQAMLWEERGVARTAGRDYAGAVADFRRAIQLVPRAHVYAGLVNALIGQGDAATALREANEGIRLARPNDISGMISLRESRARLLEQGGDLAGAIADAHAVVELQRKHGMQHERTYALIRRGRLLELQQNWAAALADYESIAKEDRNASTTRLARVKFFLRDWDGAIGEASRAVNRNAQDGEAVELLGAALLAKGDFAALHRVGDAVIRVLERPPLAVLNLREVAGWRLAKSDNALRDVLLKSTDAGWDRSVALHLIDQLSAEELQAAAREDQPQAKERTGAAHYFLGLRALHQDDLKTARLQLSASLKHGAPGTIEHILAGVELARLPAEAVVVSVPANPAEVKEPEEPMGDDSRPTNYSPFIDYLVVQGDTLASIAAKFSTTRGAILDANPEMDPAKLPVGQKIRVPAP